MGICLLWSMGILVSHQQNGVVAADWHTEPKVFTFWSFPESSRSSAIGPECYQLCVSLEFYLRQRAEAGWATSEFPGCDVFNRDPALVS